MLGYFKAKQPSSGICTNLAVQRLTFGFFSPARTIFLLFHHYYSIYSACALQAASLKKCMHTTFVANFAYRTKHLTLQSICFCRFCRMSYVQGTGMKPSPRSLAANGSCIQNLSKEISCHLSELQKTFGDEKRKHVCRQFEYFEYTCVKSTARHPVLSLYMDSCTT